jgi:divalent metal cation (Fe/Co/Zn/Cd) transporter
MTETEDASVRTVIVAVAANLLVAVAKAVAAVLTGSAAMLAETTHSIADTCNELLLYVGVRHGMRPADDHHPLATVRPATTGRCSRPSASSSSAGCSRSPTVS